MRRGIGTIMGLLLAATAHGANPVTESGEASVVIQATPGPRDMEKLDRGVVAVHRGGSEVYVGWRMFGTEAESVGYNVYRDSTKINAAPITNSTNYLDVGGSVSSTYSVAAVMGGVEQERSDRVDVWSDYVRDIPLRRPAGGTTPDGLNYDYIPGDVSVGDLDGDGEYEIVLKWDPSNAKDSAQSGYTGNVYLDAYEMDGTFLWRIDLGINIRAGAHYTQFMVYDFDSDGRAEMVCKTADGTTDSEDTILGNPSADWRNGSGRILDGPEYLSIFDGRTGAFIDTVDYVPPRGNVSDWGDGYGNRVDRFLACVAYLDGEHPSVVMCRGYYTRTVLAAWDFVGGQLIQRWVFDSDDRGNSAYAGQGNHNLSVADVDSDGKDEIIYGSCAIDDDGTGLYSTGLGHGDALHVSDMDPDRPGLEVWMPHETSASGATYRDAATGEIIWEHLNSGDVGRGVAAHIDSRYPGYQLWSYATGGVYNTDGTKISDNVSGKMMNFVVWWTGDLQREFLGAADGDGRNPVLEKWGGDGAYRLLSLYSIPTSYDTKSINGTKANPCLSGDILGDWREELIFHSGDNTKLRIFTTPEITSHRIYTLMHDPQYRLAIAWQNVSYNQPPHSSFYIGADMNAPPAPNIRLVNSEIPTAPIGLSSTPGDETVSLDWSDNSEEDLAGYTVYRSTTSGSGYAALASDLASSEYIDDAVVNNTTFYYVVTATDTAANESVHSAEVRARPVDFSEGPVAYWDFNDPSLGAADAQALPDSDGYTVWREAAIDKSGNGNHLTTWDHAWAGFDWSANSDQGDSSIRAAGDYPAAYTWSARSQPDGIDLETALLTNFTVEALFTATGGGYRTVLGRDARGVSETEVSKAALYLGLDPENHPVFEFTDTHSNTVRLIGSATVANDDTTWHHLAGVSDGSSVSIYLDGELVASENIAMGAIVSDSMDGSGWHAGGWSIGRGLWDGDHTDRWYGKIDAIAISGLALAPESFVITGAWPMSYASYTDSFGIAGAPFAGDSDSDGMPDGVEYYLGTDPTKPTVPGTLVKFSEDLLSVSYPFNPSASDVTGGIEWTTDLTTGNWSESGITYTPDTSTGIMVAHLSVPLSDKLFVRLKVTVQN